MSPNEITTLIASKYAKELDVPFKKMLYESVKYWRSTLIKQSLDKQRKDSKYFRQTIYLPMRKVDVLMVAPETLQYAAETVIEVPLPIRVSDQVFDYIGGIDGNSPFGYADEGSLSYLKEDENMRHFVFAQYVNRKVRTTELPNLAFTRISGIFNSPEEAMIYETYPAQPDVDWWNRDIPMSGDVEQRVVQCLLKIDFEKMEGHEKTEDYQTPVNKEDL